MFSQLFILVSEPTLHFIRVLIWLSDRDHHFVSYLSCKLNKANLVWLCQFIQLKIFYGYATQTSST